MFRFILRRVLWAIPTLFVVTFLVYCAIRFGTDPVQSFKRTNIHASAKDIARYRKINGLYEGFGGYVRGYFEWLHHFITGPWPRTIKGRQRVWPRLKDSLANSIRLGLVASIVGTLNFNLVAAFRIKGASCGFSSACASSAQRPIVSFMSSRTQPAFSACGPRKRLLRAISFGSQPVFFPMGSLQCSIGLGTKRLATGGGRPVFGQ